MPTGAFDTIADLELLRDITVDAENKLVHFDLSSAVAAGSGKNKINGYQYTQVMYGANA